MVLLHPRRHIGLHHRHQEHVLIHELSSEGLQFIPAEQQYQIHPLFPLSLYYQPALQNLAYQSVYLPPSLKIGTTSTAIPNQFISTTLSGPARISTTSSGLQQICSSNPVVATLASQIMENNPGMDPLRAIELAKQCLLGHDSNPLGSSDFLFMYAYRTQLS